MGNSKKVIPPTPLLSYCGEMNIPSELQDSIVKTEVII